MELRHLKYFSVLAEELHFGRAAGRLFIAQPPLSRQIKLLEEELGVPLFERNNKKVVLTEFGKYLQSEAARLLGDAEKIKNILHQMKQGKKGKIVLGYVGAVMHSYLPKLLLKVNSDLKDVTTVLKEMDNLNQVEAIQKGTLDIGFVRTPLKAEGLICRQIYSDSFSLIISETHPLAERKNIDLNDLKNEPYIGFPKDCAPAMHDSIMSIFTQCGFYPETIHESTQINSILRLVESKLGYSIVPTSVKEGYALGIRYYELDRFNEKTFVSLLYSPANKNNLTEKIVKIILNSNI